MITSSARLTLDQSRALAEVRKGKRHSLFYGGARSGKTFLVVYLIVLRALMYGGSRHLIYRLHLTDAINSIWLETLPKVIALFSGLSQKITQNETKHIVFFPNGSEIWVAGVDDSRNADSVLGKEYVTIYANEASQIPYLTAWKVRTRLAQKVPGCTAREFIDLNPTTRGHWTYKEFVLKEDPIHSRPGDRKPVDNPADYSYIQLNPDGNKENIDAAYLLSLAASPESIRRRFYLGEYSNDNELQVFHCPASGFYEASQFAEWVKMVGPGNVRLAAGLDIGFEDADGFVVVAYCPKPKADPSGQEIGEALRSGRIPRQPLSDEVKQAMGKRWLIYEYKARRTGLAELAEAVKAGLETVKSRVLPMGVNFAAWIYSDTGGGGKKMVYDLQTQHKLPVRPAYKRDKESAIELLQDEVAAGSFMIPIDGAFAQEIEAIVWTKDSDTGEIVRKIDDKIFHPDIMDAILYSMRAVWYASI